MKNLFVSFVFLFFSGILFAQHGNFEKAVSKGLKAMDKAGTIEDMQDVANQFERIAEVEENSWLAGYYAALQYIRMSFEVDVAKKDEYMDQAQKWIDRIMEMDSDKSEILVLQAFLYQGRIQVNQMARGMEYSLKVDETLAKAEKANPANPRTYLLRGQQTYFMPAFIGGGKERACPILEQAKGKFDAFEPQSSITPDWGKESLDALLATCGEEK